VKRFLRKQAEWLVVRPLVTLGLLQAASWFFGLDPVILGWVAHHLVSALCWIIAYAIFVHLIWDREEDRLKKEYDDKIDGILGFVNRLRQVRNQAEIIQAKEILNDLVHTPHIIGRNFLGIMK